MMSPVRKDNKQTVNRRLKAPPVMGPHICKPKNTSSYKLRGSIYTSSLLAFLVLNSFYRDVLKLNYYYMKNLCCSTCVAIARFETVFFIPAMSPLGYEPLNL